MIRCEGVGFSYPDGTEALRGVDLAIEAGEQVALVGRNGSGKTTLVRLWNGLLRPTAGEVLVAGRPTTGRRVAELARTVGLTFQDPATQLFARTCREEVAFGARNVGQRGAALDAAVEASLVAVDLKESADANPYDLGRSARRLLALACVLAMRTPVVVLDEPTIGLDRRERQVVDDVVRNLGQERRTVIAISHDERFVATFPRALRLEAGRLVADGPAGEVLRP